MHLDNKLEGKGQQLVNPPPRSDFLSLPVRRSFPAELLTPHGHSGSYAPALSSTPALNSYLGAHLYMEMHLKSR